MAIYAKTRSKMLDPWLDPCETYIKWSIFDSTCGWSWYHVGIPSRMIIHARTRSRLPRVKYQIVAAAASSFFQIFSFFIIFSTIFFRILFFGSFLYFKELIVAKNYIESWGQSFGTPDFDLRVWSVPASGSKVPGVQKIRIHKSNRSIWGRYQRMES